MTSLATFSILPSETSCIVSEILESTQDLRDKQSDLDHGEGTSPYDRLADLARRANSFLSPLNCHQGLSQPSRKEAPGELSSLLKRAEVEIANAYTEFYKHQYDKLPTALRQLYTDLRLVEFVIFLVGSYYIPDEQTDLVEANLDKMVGALDKALIIAGANELSRGDRIQSILLAQLDQGWHQVYKPLPQSDHELMSARDFSPHPIFVPPVSRPAPRRPRMSMEEFSLHMETGNAQGQPCAQPVIIQNMMDDWPAMTTHPWRKPQYLLNQTIDGKRLVPVEVGRSYVDDSWGQELITFKEHLDRIEGNSMATHGEDNVTNTTASTTYLAQHELFKQIPQLYNDILTPDLCYSDPPPHPVSSTHDKPELDVPKVNAWLGPAGTISPLHTDGYHNLLSQVVGSKYVRLYSPFLSEDMASRGTDENGINMSNTSEFDVGLYEGWDEPPAGEEPPSQPEVDYFKDLPYFDCVLQEGEMLYIPIGWWHYVRSLSTSFSVSFWFNGDPFRGEE